MYQQYPVPPALQDDVSFFYAMETHQPGPTFTPDVLMPSGTCILGIPYAGNWRVASKGFTGLLPPSYVCGQQTNSYTLTPTQARCGIVGAALKPTALWKWLGRPVDALTDQVVAASAFFGPAFEPFAARYPTLRCLDARLACLSDFLETQVRQKRESAHLVEAALEVIYQTKGCLTAADLLRRVPISERYLQVLFKKQTGLSPTTYARIIRFNHLFLEYTRQKDAHDLAFLTALYNYYDASHFNKDFKKFFGQAPSALDLAQFELLMELVRNGPYLTMVSEGPR